MILRGSHISGGNVVLSVFPTCEPVYPQLPRWPRFNPVLEFVATVICIQAWHYVVRTDL